MFTFINNIKTSSKSVNSQLFLDYLALELNYDNNYKFSDYLNIFNILNKNKNIKKYNNINNKNDYLDLVCNSSSFYTNVRLYYNEQNLLAYFEFDNNFYAFLINIKLFKNYKNMQHFVNELEEYIEFTSNS